MSIVLLLAALVVVGIISLVILDTLIVKPTVVAGLVIAVAIFITAFGEVGRIPVAGVPLSLPDGVFVLVTLAGVARLLRARQLTGAHLLLVLMWGLLIFSLLQGVSEYAAQAGRELRPFLRFFGPALYFSTIPPDPRLLERLGTVWVRGIMVLLALILVRLAAVATGIDLGPLESRHPSASFALRVLPGYQSFTVGQAFVLLLPTAVLRPNDRTIRIMVIALGAVTLILNRRTVYVAVLVGLVLLVYRSRALRQGIAPLLFGVVVTIAAAAALFSGYLPETPVDEDPIVQSPTDPGTLLVRIQGWEYLLAERQQGIEWMIGAPLGLGFDRVQNGNEVDWNPHSFYVLLLVRVGLVGTLAFLSLYAISMLQLRRMTEQSTLLAPGTLFVLLAMQLVFFITWVAPIEQGVLLGIACAFYRPASREQSAPRDGATEKTANEQPAPSAERSFAPTRAVGDR